MRMGKFFFLSIFDLGTRFGKGIYFAANASMSVGYASADVSGTRYMYIARVAAGDFTVGNAAMIVPPTKSGNIKYDSVVDNVANPSIFVMFYDNQYYPEYLIIYPILILVNHNYEMRKAFSVSH